MEYRNDMIIYGGSRQFIFDIFKHKGIDFRLYQRRRKNGLDIKDAFFECLKGYSFKNYKEIVERGMPPKFRSLKQFCVFYSLDYDKILRIMECYPKYNMQQIYQHYLQINSSTNPKFVYYGVSLKAICLKFQLDFEYCKKILVKQPDFPLEDLLELALIHSPIFPCQFPKQFKIVRKFIDSCSTIEEVEKWCDTTHCDSVLTKSVLFYKKRLLEIKTALKVYQIVHFFEEGWEELYSSEIQRYHQNELSCDFTPRYSSLKKQVKEKYLQEMDMSETDLSEYYRKYYDDYIKNFYNGDAYWNFNKKRSKKV